MSGPGGPSGPGNDATVAPFAGFEAAAIAAAEASNCFSKFRLAPVQSISSGNTAMSEIAPASKTTRAGNRRVPERSSRRSAISHNAPTSQGYASECTFHPDAEWVADQVTLFQEATAAGGS